MDAFIFGLMIAGGVVFIGGITVVLLLLAFYVPNASKREIEKEAKASRQSGKVFGPQPSSVYQQKPDLNSMTGAHTI